MPNNGTTQQSLQSRRDFDARLHAAAAARSRAAGAAALLVAGDLNVAPRSDLDLSDRTKFPAIRGQPAPASPLDAGFPCCTPAEQLRFGSLLRDGGLADVWRALHPGVAGGWTWAGAGAQSRGCLPGQSMRLEHFLASAAGLLPRVEVCEAAQQAGHRTFHGSDHAPVWLRLAAAAGAAHAAHAGGGGEGGEGGARAAAA